MQPFSEGITYSAIENDANEVRVRANNLVELDLLGALDGRIEGDISFFVWLKHGW